MLTLPLIALYANALDGLSAVPNTGADRYLTGQSRTAEVSTREIDPDYTPPSSVHCASHTLAPCSATAVDIKIRADDDSHLSSCEAVVWLTEDLLHPCGTLACENA